MKKMTALLLVLMMLLGTIGAVAEVDLTNGYSSHVTVNVNKDLTAGILSLMLMNGENQPTPEQVNAVLDLANMMSFDANTDGTNVEVKFNLNDQPIFGMVENVSDDGSLLLYMDMLAGHVISCSADEAVQLGAQMNQQPDAATQQLVEQIAAETEAAMQNLNVTVVSQQETEMVYNDVTFNYVTVSSIPADEVMTIVSQFMMDILDAAMQTEANLQTQQAVQMLNEVKTKLESLPAKAAGSTVYITEYVVKDGETVQEGNAYTVYELKIGSYAAYLSVAKLGKLTSLSAFIGKGVETADEIMTAATTGQGDGVVIEMNLEEGETAGSSVFDISVMAKGIPFGAFVETVPTENGEKSLMELYLLTFDAPMVTINAETTVPGEAVAAIDTTGKKIITFTEMQNMTEETSNGLTLDAQQGVNAMLVNAVQAAPEQMQILLNALTVEDAE